MKVPCSWNEGVRASWSSLLLWLFLTGALCSFYPAAAAAKSLQLCPTLCDPIDCSPPGSPVPGILQARTLEWVAISFSNAWKWKVKVKSLSPVQLFTTPWTVAYQAPPSMGFSRQEYLSGLPLPSAFILLTNAKSKRSSVMLIMYFQEIKNPFLLEVWGSDGTVFSCFCGSKQ